MSDVEETLTRVERAAIELGRFANERPIPKRLQTAFLDRVTRAWVGPAVGRRVYADNVDWLLDAAPDRGVVIVANHRSFFDLYVIMLILFQLRSRWIERMTFPVRANFFYEKPLGVLVNLLIGGVSMYPPIFRDPKKAELNKDALERVIRMLGRPGDVVGLHPEGTRGKGPDPYELLPAQPGVGQIVLQARPIVVPVFINGLPNDLKHGVFDSYKQNARRDNPVIAVFGQELDYSELTAKKPRAALYKQCSDKMRTAIAELSVRERELRAACASGAISADDANWLPARTHRRRGR